MVTVPHKAGGAIPRLLLLVAGLGLASLTGVRAEEAVPKGQVKVGVASWYGHEFGGRKTASGRRFDPNGLTGAHRTLPLGTQVRVTNLSNGRSVLVTITDRGPFVHRREIDLSLGAAKQLGMVSRGVQRVKVEPLI